MGQHVRQTLARRRYTCTQRNPQGQPSQVQLLEREIPQKLHCQQEPGQACRVDASHDEQQDCSHSKDTGPSMRPKCGRQCFQLGRL
eukprot:2664097-Pyramimonas_sp.AAC.1